MPAKNAELTKEGLTARRRGDIDPKEVQQLDSIKAILILEWIREMVTQREVDPSHFNFDVFRP
jgi:hypothetical protein